MINQIGNDGRKSKRIKEKKREEKRIAVVGLLVVVVGTGVVRERERTLAATYYD